jgi:hypothetical protein
MSDLADLLRRGGPFKGSFLSRMFGIFNEEIIRIWARDPRSSYNIHEKRPTLYGPSGHFTLDFLFERQGVLFISEMKCEIQYQNYRYWRLENSSQLAHHVKPAFQLFLQFAKNPLSLEVKAGKSVVPKGAILVWGAATDMGIRTVKEEFGFHDILTIENCVNELAAWRNDEYTAFVNELEQWSSELFDVLRNGFA